jgi:hypothetical protein
MGHKPKPSIIKTSSICHTELPNCSENNSRKKFIFALYPCFELHRSQTISAMNKTNKILGSFIRVLLLKIQNNNLEP